jgi:predicted unusual protein kinase regulating ubiquinone biosynthesis (AarF/ABC1/UbiB family)
MAERFGSELIVLEVVADGVDGADVQLERYTAELCGPRARARIAISDDPAEAIVRAAHDEDADLVVVGNVGMHSRREFLLGNVPNRVSHRARCSVMIVNTFAGDPFVPDTGADQTHRRGALVGRAARIARVLLGAVRRRAGTPTERARALRLALQDLGPTFAKLGQILSTRPDLLGPEMIEELSLLQDHVDPLTEAEVVAAMERELRVPWEDVFASIESVPLAAGTIGQVNRATLESGERVVVKVQRPTAADDILRDLRLLELVADKLGGQRRLREVVDLPAVVEHLGSSLREELDFLHEADNVERMREVLAPYPRLAVPRVYRELSTSRLLVMEEVQGIPVREAPDGPARREAARQLLESYYCQIVTAGCFHADPHPGNLMWWQERIWFLDFGMVGTLDDDTRQQLALLLMAFWRDDAELLTEVLLAMSQATGRGDLDLDALRDDVDAFLGSLRGSSLREIQLGPTLQRLGELAARHRLRLPAALALAGKALSQMQLATADLDPDLDPFSVAGSFFTRRALDEIRAYADPRRMFYEAQKLRARVTRLAEAVESLAGVRPGAKLQVELRGTERLEAAVRKAVPQIVGSVMAGTIAGAIVAERLRRR